MSAVGWCALILLVLVLATLLASVREGRELEREARERCGINDDEDGDA